MKIIFVYYLLFVSSFAFSQDSTYSLNILPIRKLSFKNELINLRLIPKDTLVTLLYGGSDSLTFYLPKSDYQNDFYMNAFEVTNKEYREFINYTRDSIAHILLNHFQKGSKNIDWTQSINYFRKDILLRIEPMMVIPDNRIFGKVEIDPEKIIYKLDGNNSILIYPDTLTWLRLEHKLGYLEPLVKRYFSDKKYANYPVVGITQLQAKAFCQWKTKQWNNELNKAGIKNYAIELRLPNNTEWEAGAKSGKNKVNFGNVFGEKNKLMYQINYGEIIDENGFRVKEYIDDGWLFTCPVNTYLPNDYGIYNMPGNVAEWTSDTIGKIFKTLLSEKTADTTVTNYIKEIKQSQPKSPLHNMSVGEWVNTTSDHIVTKGGSWFENPFYLQRGVCQFFKATQAYSFVGFRYVVIVKPKS